MGKLAAVVGKEKLACIDCVTDALTKRIEFFAEMGCRASDHGLDYVLPRSHQGRGQRHLPEGDEGRELHHRRG